MIIAYLITYNINIDIYVKLFLSWDISKPHTILIYSQFTE